MKDAIVLSLTAALTWALVRTLEIWGDAGMRWLLGWGWWLVRGLRAL